MLTYGVEKHTRATGKIKNLTKMIYSDEIFDPYVIRTFHESTDIENLMWHRDEEDRIIISSFATDWQLQMEDSLPISLNSEVKIPAGIWHRLIKGTGSLTLKIVKINERLN